MNTLKDYVNWKLTHADKVAEAEGYPLVMENCKANKRMKQLEIYGSSVQEGTPSPENPIEVQSVGEKTVNLFDKDNFAYVTNWNVSRANISSTDTGISFVIEDKIGHLHLSLGLASDYVGKTLVLTSTSYYSTSNTQLVIRSSSGTAVKTSSRYTNNGNGLYYTTLTIEEDTYTDEILCIRLYFDKQEAGSVLEYKNIMVAESDTPVEYEPYGKYKIPVVQRGINYHNYKKFNYKEQTINGITFTPLKDGSFHLKGKLEDTTKIASYRVVIWNAIPVKAGTYHSKRHSSADITVMFGAYKKDSKFWLNINSSSNSGNATLSEDGYIGYCQIYVRANTTREIDDIVYPQLTLGTKDLPYEPYVEPVTTNIFLDEPLRKIGRDADYIDYKNKKVNRLLHEYYIDGSQTVTKYNDTICMVNGAVRCRHTYSTGLSNRFPNASYGEVNKVPYIGMANAVGYNIQITNYKQLDGVTDNVSLKEWFKTHHTTYIKPLETPREEPITLDLPKLNAKTSIIEVDTSLAPSNAKGKYIKR